MVLTTTFERVTSIDHDLQRVAAIAKDIHMKVVKCKDEGCFIVTDIKEEDVHNNSNIKKKKLKRGT